MASALEHLSSRNLQSDSYYGNLNKQDVKDARAKISLILVEAKENKIISEDKFKAMNTKSTRNTRRGLFHLSDLLSQGVDP
jgi:hypothetical protein